MKVQESWILQWYSHNQDLSLTIWLPSTCHASNLPPLLKNPNAPAKLLGLPCLVPRCKVVSEVSGCSFCVKFTTYERFWNVGRCSEMPGSHCKEAPRCYKSDKGEKSLLSLPFLFTHLLVSSFLIENRDAVHSGSKYHCVQLTRRLLRNFLSLMKMVKPVV